MAASTFTGDLSGGMVFSVFFDGGGGGRDLSWAEFTEQWPQPGLVWLNCDGAVFLPLNLITGLLGMNVGGLPGVGEPAAFAIVSSGIVVSAVVLLWLLWPE
ncbi:MAG: CorA family divalent cation transporter [Opitutales bacterium]